MKVRLDKLLADMKLSVSREKAKNEILAGWVMVNGERVRDTSKLVEHDSIITIERPGGLFVSRGGAKLDKALKYFNVNVNGKICIDVGASTGGFTDCLLKNGAEKVYAVDVGYGQLDYSLRTNNKVVVMERTNARLLTGSEFDDVIDFSVIDVSFISVLKIIPVLCSLFKDLEILSLIKPQFEAERCQMKKGIVRKKEYHMQILYRVIHELSFMTYISGLTFSPIKGPKGNIEFLLHLHPVKQESQNFDLLKKMIEKTVEEAHNTLNTTELLIED